LFREHADVQVSIDTRRMEEIIEHLMHDVADLGITLTPAEHPSLISSPVRHLQMVCVVPRVHEPASREVILARDLARGPFIVMERGTPLGKLIAEAFDAAGEPLTWAMETRFCNTACAMVDAGTGCALVDGFMVQGGTYRNLVIKPFLPRIELCAYATVSKHRPLSWLTEAFLRVLEQAPSPLSGAETAHQPA
jgi:DNA-binding transcriptional LysR family regulator